jgi:type VI secretion system secreted protein Hcp
MFLKLGDIKGESTDDKHKDEIEVLAFSWGVSNSGTVAYGGGMGGGKAAFTDWQITKYVDKATPNLLKRCAIGEHIEKGGQLTVRKSGKGQQEYLLVKMEGVFVTGVTAGGSNADSAHLTETLSLQAAKVDFEYKPQKADGSLDAGVHFKYDIKATKEG